MKNNQMVMKGMIRVLVNTGNNTFLNENTDFSKDVFFPLNLNGPNKNIDENPTGTYS